MVTTSLMTMEDQTALAETPPSNPGVPMEHRAGEAVRRQETSKMAESRLGALKESKEGANSRIEAWLAQILPDLLLPLPGCPVRLRPSGVSLAKSP